jgi:hypothetical protein
VNADPAGADYRRKAVARWRYGHMKKVAYGSWRRAQRRRWLVYFRERNWMQVYPCQWTRDLRAGETGTRHWHLGHGKRSHGPIERIQHAWRKLAVWPYYRLRHRYRVARGVSACMSRSCRAHQARLRIKPGE